MLQIKGDVLPSIYSSFLKKCKLGVVIINQLVLLFSRKRPVTCYIITQSHLISKINSFFPSCFMIFEFLFLRSVVFWLFFSYRMGRKYWEVWRKFKKIIKRNFSYYLSSLWENQEHFLSPFPLLLFFPSSRCCFVGFFFPYFSSILSFWGCAKSWAGKTRYIKVY